MDGYKPQGPIGWVTIWVHTIARSWVLRARHIDSNIP